MSPIKQSRDTCFTSIVAMNGDWIALTPFAFMTPGNPSISYDVEGNWWGDKPEGIHQLTKQAQQHHLKVLLKPHFWVKDQGWAGDYDLTEEQWKIWEREYEIFILAMAKQAEELNIDMLCIGVELKTSIKKRATFWLKLIDKIRSIYHGKLTYAANWDNFGQIPFWNKLDLIGIDAYFPLTMSDTPTIKELEKAWEQPMELLSDLYHKYEKPIIFTEYGYRSTNKAAWEQWEIEGLADDELVNLEAQKNAYEALYRTFWDQEWFGGGFVWKWWEKPNAGGLHHSDYTPQNKPAEAVIRSWYSQ